jgi:hypothetical protein
VHGVHTCDLQIYNYYSLDGVQALDKCVENPIVKKILKALKVYKTIKDNFRAFELKLSVISIDPPAPNKDGEVRKSTRYLVDEPHDDIELQFDSTETERLLLYFQTTGAFTQKNEGDYLEMIAEYIKNQNVGFNKDIIEYASTRGTVTTKTGLWKLYQECSKKIRKESTLTTKIKKFLDRIFSECLVRYGRVALKAAFTSYFGQYKEFLEYIHNLIDKSYDNFKEDFRKLLTNKENKGKTGWYLEEYQEIIAKDDLAVHGESLLKKKQKKQFSKEGMVTFSNQVYKKIEKDFAELLNNYLYCLEYNIPKDTAGKNGKKPPKKAKKTVLDRGFYKVFCGKNNKKKKTKSFKTIFCGKLLAVAKTIVEKSFDDKEKGL